MATPKKPVAKAGSAKKSPVADAKGKSAPGKSAPAKKTVEVPKKGSIVGKATSAKATATAKKPTPAKSAAKSAQASKATSSPAKAAAAVKAAPAKKSAPSKSAAPAQKSAPAPKAAPAKTAAPSKKAASAPAKQGKPTAKPAPAPEKKEASVAKAAHEKKAAPAPAAPQPPVVKKETKAEKKAALKRTASAVQRVQARVAAAIPKPQPKPAPLPTVVLGREEKKSNVVVAHRRIVTAKAKEEVEEPSTNTMTQYQPEYKRSILDKEDKDTGPTYRYSDEDLAEFKDLISNRLATARRELAYQQGLITHKDAAGTEDTENRYMNMEDGSGAMEREQLAQLASRQIQFINHLEKALIRIENKTYGICRVTGKLIDKARLRAVPHATLSIEAKNGMNSK
jgi:RNA polymerase-binding transcription factor DksA